MWWLWLACKSADPVEQPVEPLTVRVATWNTSLYRDSDGALVEELQSGSEHARSVAEVLQALRPDILVLQEVDYDAALRALALLQSDYLGVGQAGQEPLTYAASWAAPSNTGVPTGLDLDGDGSTSGASDAQGYGVHQGQYGFVVLSRWPIVEEDRRTFQTLLWKAVPESLIPGDYYSADAQAVQRLSSKNHVVVPVETPNGVLNVLVAHPTPPVFDGPEDRNGKRNHDEIKLLAALVSGADWPVDDAGVAGGLSADDAFVVFGDLNADPFDGDSVSGAMDQLLDQPRVHPEVARGELIPGSDGGAANDNSPDHTGDNRNDTAGWGLRVDYVLPSAELDVTGSGVFWPQEGEPHADAVEVSDHRPVWVDLTLE